MAAGKLKNLSIRNARFAKIGLDNMCKYIIDKTRRKDLHVLEVGSFSGDSGRIFASNFVDGLVYCVDPWRSNYDPIGHDLASDPKMYNMKEIEAKFDEMASEFDNIIKYKETSEEASKRFSDKSLDMVYIDGLHIYEGVSQDLRLWYPKVKIFLCGHDYVSKHHKDVRIAVDEFCKNINYNEEIKVFSDSSWLIKLH